MNPGLPSILAAHAALTGSLVREGSEKWMTVGRYPELLKSTLHPQLFDYVALGHMHAQQMLDGARPWSTRAAWRGSTSAKRRAKRGSTSLELDPTKPRGQRLAAEPAQTGERPLEFRPVWTRPFVTVNVSPKQEDPTPEVLTAIEKANVSEAIVRVIVRLSRAQEPLLRKAEVRQALAGAQFVAYVKRESSKSTARRACPRARTESLTPLEALRLYLDDRKVATDRREVLLRHAQAPARRAGVGHGLDHRPRRRRRNRREQILVEDGAHRLFLDFGMSFGKMGDFFEDFLQPRTNSGLRDLLALGVLPKIDGIYGQDLLELEHLSETLDDLRVADASLWAADVKSYKDVEARDGRPALDGVIVSHAHMDHFQHVSMLDESVPVFCSETTKAVMETAEVLSANRFGTDVINVKRRSIAKLGKSAFFPDTPKVETECILRPVNTVCAGKPFAVGTMEAELHPVDHSVPGATAVVLRTGGKRIVYTGDLRFHGLAGQLTHRFRDAFAGSRPDVLIAEGTRIEKDTPDSEAGVAEECTRLVSQAGTALAMVAFAWKDTTRYRTMMEVARETGRTLVIFSGQARLSDAAAELAPRRPRPAGVRRAQREGVFEAQGQHALQHERLRRDEVRPGVLRRVGQKGLLDHPHRTLRMRGEGVRHRRRPRPVPAAPRLLRAERAHRPAPASGQRVRERGQRALQHGDGARQEPLPALAATVRGEPAGLRADIRPRLGARQRAGAHRDGQGHQSQAPHPRAHRASRGLPAGAGRQRHRSSDTRARRAHRPGLGSYLVLRRHRPVNGAAWMPPP